MCVALCVCVSYALSKADSCQVLGRLISFVFRTVSSIYPSPVERGGGISEVLLLWRTQPDTHGPIPTEAAFIIRPTRGIVQVITFSVALSSSEETGLPRRASGQRIQSGLAQTESYNIFVLVTRVATLQLFTKTQPGLPRHLGCLYLIFYSSHTVRYIRHHTVIHHTERVQPGHNKPQGYFCLTDVMFSLPSLKYFDLLCHSMTLSCYLLPLSGKVSYFVFLFLLPVSCHNYFGAQRLMLPTNKSALCYICTLLQM